MSIIKKYNYKEVFNDAGWFLSFISIFFILFFIMQNINHRFWMNDYDVYYSAANSFVHGEKVYGIAYGLSSGFYKYSPFALLVFTPFSLLPFYAAKVIHFIILSIAITTVIVLSIKMSRKYFFKNIKLNKSNSLLFVLFLPLLSNVYTELHLGNINTILLLVFIISLLYLIKGKDLKAALLLAFGILIKPHFIILLPLLLLRKKFKCFTYTIAAIITGLLLPALFTGMKNNIDLHKQWLMTMQLHNNSLINAQYTAYSWLYRSIGHFFFSDVVSYDKIFGIIVLTLISLAILILLIYHLKKEKSVKTSKDINESNFIFEYFLLLSIIPNITVTDSEHFLLSIPLIAFIINFLFERKGEIVYKIIAIACIVMYGLNIRDVVGQNISVALTSIGILGLSNIFIIIFCIIIHIKQIKNSTLNEQSFIKS